MPVPFPGLSCGPRHCCRDGPGRMCWRTWPATPMRCGTCSAGARSGQDRPAYPSVQAREADIERGAVSRAEDLMADLAASAMALRAMARQLPDEAWPVRVRVLDSAPFPAAGLLTRRLAEVELHHCDLGTGYSPADWPAAFATMELAEPMRSQRQDRLRYPPPSPGAKPAFPGRPPAPWKPGQRLPGSWLGTGNESRPLPTPPASRRHSPRRSGRCRGRGRGPLKFLARTKRGASARRRQCVLSVAGFASGGTAPVRC